MYKIKTINEIHDVLLIKLIIIVKVIVWIKIIKFDLRGDFIIVINIAIIKLVSKINFKIQYIFELKY